MRIQGFRGNCDSQASWGYAPALPTRTQLVFLRTSFQKMQLQQGKQTAKLNLLRKRGLLAHTSAAFLKNCCTEKLFSRLRLVAYSHLYYFKNSRSCDSNSARTAP